MTNRELSVFDEMFNMIFTAANERRLAEDGAASAFDVDTRGPLRDFMKNMSKQHRVYQKVEDPELDRLKEQLALCSSDYAMLEWAEQEVFGPSIRAEEAAREAFSAGKPQPSHLQPPVYPRLLAALMSAACEKYDDPHLALTLFEHVRNLSPLSYIFGCTTPAYNELLETRWGSFRDLRGVHAALKEMRVNGISPDSRTRALVSTPVKECYLAVSNCYRDLFPHHLLHGWVASFRKPVFVSNTLFALVVFTQRWTYVAFSSYLFSPFQYVRADRAVAAAFESPAPVPTVGGLMLLLLVLYIGYAIPRPSMIGALKWISYINVSVHRPIDSFSPFSCHDSRFGMASRVYIQRVPHTQRNMLKPDTSWCRV